jgi:phage/plasmid-associated DNA primase
MCCSGYFLFFSTNVLKVSSGTHTGSQLCVHVLQRRLLVSFRNRINGKQRHTHRDFALCLHVLQRVLLVAFSKRIKGKQRHTHRETALGLHVLQRLLLVAFSKRIKGKQRHREPDLSTCAAAATSCFFRQTY